MIKGGTYIQIGLGFNLHPQKKQRVRKEEGVEENRLSYKQENK